MHAIDENQLWASMATGVQRMLTASPAGLSVIGPGSAVAFSGAPVTDLNLAFAWSDATALDALRERKEDFILVSSPAGKAAVAERAHELGLDSVPDALPVWTAQLTGLELPSPKGNARRVEAGEMNLVREVLAEAFGLQIESMEIAFPDSIAGTTDVYLVQEEGRGVAALMAVREGDFASLWSGGTIPEARQRGVFTDLIVDVIHDQKARGARYMAGITEAVGSGRAVASLGATHTSDAHVWLRGASVGELLQ